MSRSKSPLFVIFSTVFLDLVGFGMVIPLVGIYGRHYGASGFELGLLGAIYSLMQFLFAPMWGALSDRWGRRPILLISLVGSTLAYLGFSLAGSFWFLIMTRMFAGIFAANISAAQAYIADITTPKDRAKGMGMIGAAFGIGFTLGPPLGGIASAKLGLWAPGAIAALLCGLNAVLAYFRLEESLVPELRKRQSWIHYLPLSRTRLEFLTTHPLLFSLIISFFGVTFAFSNMEQTFSLLFQTKFSLETGQAGYVTGMVLMWAGFLGALIQGGLIRKLVPRFGEVKLILIGIALQTVGMLIFPYGETVGSYYLLVIPIAVGSSLINPCLSALISKSVGPQDQGTTLGLTQGFGSLARAFGPLTGLTVFSFSIYLPYWIAAAISLIVMLVLATALKSTLRLSQSGSQS